LFDNPPFKTMSNNAQDLLKSRLQQILANKNLATQRELINTMASELGIDILNYAAALLYLTHAKITAEIIVEPVIATIALNTEVKMLRYRLDVGSNQQVTAEALKKLLINESGVDKKYLNYINIQPDYTIVELPDAMPADIFQHLKTVEINQHKLAIKRIKPRPIKKRGKHHLRRGRSTKESNKV
jgi:hypothetical protein